MGLPCDAWHTIQSPTGSRLERCSNPARYNLTIEVNGEVYALYHCQSCRDELVAKAENEEIEILDETSLPLCDLVIVKRTN
jgi:hypothetical protein